MASPAIACGRQDDGQTRIQIAADDGRTILRLRQTTHVVVQRGKPDRAERSVWLTGVCNMIFLGCVALVFIIFARSLVRLIGSVPVTRRLAANTTIGITESDNLEVRIMSLLKTPKLTPRRKTFLLVTAVLVLAVPSLAATSFGFTLDIEQQKSLTTGS